MSNDELKLKFLRKIEFVKDLIVPITSPPFVHDLRFNLWDEISRFAINDLDHIALPLREVGVIRCNKFQQILFRFQRMFCKVWLDILYGWMNVVVLIILRLSILPSSVLLLIS